VQIDAGSIIGSTVRGTDGRDVGKVSRLMVDPREGRIKSVVISLGGVLGVGSKAVSVPWESVKLGQDDQKIVVTVEQHLLDSAPSASPSSEERGRGTRQ
jgi:sporulation protein YlmC with PRC-barrel domain